MPTDADTDAQNTCSGTGGPGSTTADCPSKKVVTLQWDKDETWCSEGGPISGTTVNYSDGEKLSISVTNPGEQITTLQATVSGNAFSAPWDVIDVLPTGGPSWKPRRSLMGDTSGVSTPKPMDVRFIPNVKRDKKAHTSQYNRTETGATAPHQVGVECRFELESVNYLLTFYGGINYVRGIGRERYAKGILIPFRFCIDPSWRLLGDLRFERGRRRRER